MHTWFNTTDYTIFELSLTLLGSVLWVILYIEIIRNAQRHRFIEMPLYVIAGNFAWEFIYSFPFSPYNNLGEVYLWGYRAWFFLDIYIVILGLRYGYKQFEKEIFRKNIKPLFFTLVAFWLLFIWSFGVSGFDNMPVHGDGSARLGGTSAYILNLIISAGYLFLFLNYRDRYHFATHVGWLKIFGTGCFSLFFALTDSHNIFLLTLAAAVFVLDALYIILRKLYPPIPNIPLKQENIFFPVNPAFEKLWEENPDQHSYFEQKGLRLRQISFDHWQVPDGELVYQQSVIEGNIIFQKVVGRSTKDSINLDIFRSVVRDMDFGNKKFYFFSNAVQVRGNDSQVRKNSVTLFSEPIHSKLETYLVVSPIIHAAFSLAVPFNPQVMNKWNVFSDEHEAITALLREFAAHHKTKDPLPKRFNSLSGNSYHTERLKQLYTLLAKISDNDLDNLSITHVPEDDEYRHIFEAVNLVLEDKRRQLGDLEQANTELGVKNTQLEAERENSDALLLNVLPASIAKRLKSGERDIADHYECVSILFADIVNFTPLSAEFEPRKMVSLLNNLYTRFDRLTEHFGVERIKTIGDAYMVVGGAPEPCEDHAERIANFALAMQNEMKKFSLEFGRELLLRIGISSGEAVGAVVGEKKFAYDLWSDAVNTASRMESHGEPGKIHTTKEFKDALGEKFSFLERTEITVKGKGIMTTYFLLESEPISEEIVG
ncbi:MAG: adenylate/guanylate cyclase domain-containing protein [Bacteroidota bacterium]